MTKGPEALVEAHLLAEARKLGGRSYKWVPLVAGLPDRLVILPMNQIFLVELKSSRGSRRAAQKVMHSRLARIGVHVVVLNSKDAVDRWLGGIELGRPTGADPSRD